MFTNNYIALRKGVFLCSSTSSTEIYKIVNAAGDQISCYSDEASGADVGGWMNIGRCRSLVTGKASLVTAVYAGVYFGSGSTEAKPTDYTLENPITAGLTITSLSESVKESQPENGKYVFSADLLVENTTGEGIIIREIGLFTPVTKTSSEVYLTLMNRMVLSEPITIPAGESKVVTYKITFNQTLNVE